MSEVIIIKVLSIIVTILITALITKVFNEKKYTNIVQKMDNIEHLIIKITSKLDDVDAIKQDVDVIFNRLRVAEAKIMVLESK